MIGALLVVIGLLGAAYILLAMGDSLNSSASPQVTKIAQAIAQAEGFNVAGSRAARDHNPGNMTQDLIGKAVGSDGGFVVYGSDDDGWANLYAQINAWISGSSANATAASTIADISQFYTSTDQNAWAANVALAAGVSIDTPIGEIG